MGPRKWIEAEYSQNDKNVNINTLRSFRPEVPKDPCGKSGAVAFGISPPQKRGWLGLASVSTPSQWFAVRNDF
jgi:hypothetical protein